MHERSEGVRHALGRAPAGPRVAFLLAQLGFHSTQLWKDRLAPLGVDPRHVVLLRHVAAAEGQSQQALGKAMQIRLFVMKRGGRC